MVLPSDPSQVYVVDAAKSVNAAYQDIPSPDLVFPENNNNNNKKENQMADVDTSVLSSEHGAIRHDVGLAEANIRDKVGNAEARLEKGLGDNRYTVANEARALAQQIGGELNGISAEIGAGRREAQSGFADTRYNVAETSGDIRREAAEHRAFLTQENMKGFDRVNQDVLRSGWENDTSIKDARYDINTRIANVGDRIVDRVEGTKDSLLARSWDMGRDIVDNKVQLTALGYQVRDGFFAAAKDAEINALKTQMEVAKQTTYLSDKIDAENEKTRDLISALKKGDQDRMLIERNAELVEEAHWGRHWRHHGEQNQWASQFAQLQSQMQAFNSQLQETRQGMVNFGTMAGVGQTSTSNNVR